MNKLVDIFLSIVVFVGLPLLLIFMFLWMPFKFVAASYNLYRVDSTTDGSILAVSVEYGDEDASATRVKYTYVVNGQTYTSKRLGPGVGENKSMESGGDALAEKYSAGDKVTVYYDSGHPSFSLLEYGWPKWSIGFSLGVWGIVCSMLFKDFKKKRSIGLGASYIAIDAIPYLGFVIVFAFPQYIRPEQLYHFIWIYLLLCIILLTNFFWKKHRKTETKCDGLSFETDIINEHGA